MTTPIHNVPTTTAIIIPFPVRAKKAPDPVVTQAPSEIDPQTRLVNALSKLQEALAMQKTAVADFRDKLGTLRDTVQGLGSSLQSYDSKLGDLKTGVEKIGEHSNKTIEILKDY